MAEEKEIKMVIFDCDGTLWDSTEEVTAAWNEIFDNARNEWSKKTPDYQDAARMLPEMKPVDVRNVMGKTMKEIEEIIMPDCNPEKRSPLFKRCETYEVEYIEKHGAKLYPEVEETLQKLIKLGFQLAIVSNCQTGYVKAFIASTGFAKYFCDYEEWGNTLLPKGENIKLVMERNGCSKAVYVGDTQKDLDAAIEAGVPFIWASYGFGTVTRCDAEAKEFRKLKEAVETLLNKN